MDADREMSDLTFNITQNFFLIRRLVSFLSIRRCYRRIDFFIFLLCFFFLPYSYATCYEKNSQICSYQNNKNKDHPQNQKGKKTLTKNSKASNNNQNTNRSASSQTQPEPPKIGNFILPTSQQPGPLIGFGENILEKGQTQLFLFADDFVGINKHFVDLIPGVIYGITNRLSVFFNQPIAVSYKENNNQSSGLEDSFLQFEYTYHDKKTYDFAEQGTIVATVIFPTGSSGKIPHTGFGSSSFFWGTTYNRSYINWFGFVSPGVLLTTSKNNTKFGDEYFYQFGLGRNLFDIDSSWIFAMLVEMDGLYIEKDKINGEIDPDTGGNRTYVTPSLWISSNKLIIQLGIGLPITQHLYGDQKRENYLLAANVGWTF